MKRSGVFELVVLMPMRVRMQWEGEKLVAVMPGWLLPDRGLLVEGRNVSEALDMLERKMRQYWAEPSKVK